MKTTLGTLAVLSVLFLSQVVISADFGAVPPTEDRMNEMRPWVQKLGDPSWKVTQQAGEKVLEFGEDVVPLLREAAEADDLNLAKNAQFYLSFLSSGLGRSYDSEEVRDFLITYEEGGVYAMSVPFSLAQLPNQEGIPALMRILMAERDVVAGKSAALAVLWALPYSVTFDDFRKLSPTRMSVPFPDPALLAERNRAAHAQRLELVTKIFDYLKTERSSTPGSALLSKVLEVEMASWEASTAPDMTCQSMREKLQAIFDAEWVGISREVKFKNHLYAYHLSVSLAEILYNSGGEAQSDEFLAQLRKSNRLALNSCTYGNQNAERGLSIIFRTIILGNLGSRGRWDSLEAEVLAFCANLQPSEVPRYQAQMARLLYGIGKRASAAKLLKSCLNNPFRHTEYTLIEGDDDDDDFGVYDESPANQNMDALLKSMLVMYQAADAWQNGDVPGAKSLLENALNTENVEQTDVDTLILAWRIATEQGDDAWLGTLNPLIDSRLDGIQKKISAPDLLKSQKTQSQNEFAWLAACTERRLPEALEFIQSALNSSEESKKSGSMRDTLAHVYFAMGRFDDAVCEQRLAIRYAPNEVEIMMNLERFEAALRNRP